MQNEINSVNLFVMLIKELRTFISRKQNARELCEVYFQMSRRSFHALFSSFNSFATFR